MKYIADPRKLIAIQATLCMQLIDLRLALRLLSLLVASCRITPRTFGREMARLHMTKTFNKPKKTMVSASVIWNELKCLHYSVPGQALTEKLYANSFILHPSFCIWNIKEPFLNITWAYCFRKFVRIMMPMAVHIGYLE